MEFFNEVSVSVVLLFYIMGTDIVENEDIRYYAGYGIVAKLFANIGLNLVFFFYNAYFIVKPKFIRFWNIYGCKKKKQTVPVMPEISVEATSITQNSFINEPRAEMKIKPYNMKLQREPEPESTHNQKLWWRQVDET